MDKQNVVNVIRESIISNPELTKAIFGLEKSIPEQIDEVIISISSLDFVDLMIEIESRLHIEVSECMLNPRITIGELAQRIIDYV